VTKLRRDLQEARKELEEMKRLLGDPEVAEILRQLIEERRNQRESGSSF